MNLTVLAGTDLQVQGGAFHPNLPKGRATGAVTISFTAVHFHSDKGGFDLPTDGLEIKLGGASDRLLFFTHPTHPQVTIHTADLSLLNHPVLMHNPAFAAHRKRIRTRRRVSWLVLYGIVGMLFAAGAGLFLSRDHLVRTAASAVPVDWEIAAGDKLFEQIIASKRLVQDATIEAQLKQITDPLVAGIKDNRYPLKFHIVEDATLNAFAIPGGHVVIHSGLLMAAEQPEEVAGVLGHEIAHVTQRHSIRSILSSAGLYLVLQAMLGDVTSVVAVLANNSAFLLDRKFSRDFERDSDNHGWDYLLAANIRPDGMITFFQKMEAEERRLREKLKDATMIDVDPGALEVLSTHPATEERLKNLQAKWDALDRKSGFHTFDLNYAGFKASLRAKLHQTNDATTGSDQKP
jgi:predicted Zn-dependent protease